MTGVVLGFFRSNADLFVRVISLLKINQITSINLSNFVCLSQQTHITTIGAIVDTTSFLVYAGTVTKHLVISITREYIFVRTCRFFTWLEVRLRTAKNLNLRVSVAMYGTWCAKFRSWGWAAAEAKAPLGTLHMIKQALAFLIKAHLTLSLKALPTITDAKIFWTIRTLDTWLIIDHTRDFIFIPWPPIFWEPFLLFF